METSCICGRQLRLKDAAAGKKIRCSECGEVFRVPSRTRRKRTLREEEADERNFLESSYSSGRSTRQMESGSPANRIVVDLMARTIGLGIAISTIVLGAKAFGSNASISRGAQNIDYPRLLWFVFLGIPGLYIAAKGMTFGPVTTANRIKGLSYVGAGLGLMIVAVGASALTSIVESAMYGPTIVLGAGAFFLGAAAIVVGLIATITGEDMGDAVKRKRK